MTFPNLMSLGILGQMKGLGYMSLGFRLPNFPISQIGLGHLGWDYLGNWEIGKYVPVTISQLGSLCLKIITRVLDKVTIIISITIVRVTITHDGQHQSCFASHTSTTVALKLVFCQIQIQEIGKWPNFPTRYILPNFPKDLSPSQHDLGNWEMVTGTYFPISQLPKSPAQMGQHDLGNWEIAGGTDFPISQFPKRSQPI